MSANSGVGTTTDDRQRQRAERGIGSKPARQARERRPAPPRRRRPALAALAVLLIVGGAALSGLLALRLDSREPMLVLAQDVPAGTEITESLLGESQVASDSGILIPAGDVGQVLGTYARVALTEGQLLDTTMLSTTEPIGATVVQVGIPLTSGKVPVGLRSGDEVRLVRTGDSAGGGSALAIGLIVSTDAESDEGIADAGERRSATVLVPIDAADAIIDAAGNDQLGVALMRRGIATEDAALRVLTGAGTAPTESEAEDEEE